MTESIKNRGYVTYRDFGAVGDGKSNDFPAIFNAHKFANENRLAVRADDGAEYYVGSTVVDGEAAAAVIKTDVYWGESKIIIDDTYLDYYAPDKVARTNVFSVESDYETEIITDRQTLEAFDGCGEQSKKLPIALGYPALLVIYDENDMVFRRWGGYSAKDGTPKRELILTDGEGNIDESTPFMFNYDRVTRLEIRRADCTPIRLCGGKFVTRACRINTFPRDEVTGERKVVGGYFARGLAVKRSEVTLCGVEHYIEGEFTVREQAELGVGGACYAGFFVVSYANNVTLENCVLTGRRCYQRPQGGTTGTYDFNAGTVNKIRLIGCTQSNFTVDQTTGTAPTADTAPEDVVYSMSRSSISGSMICWGIGGTNFCKNMEYDGCKLSRFDAHQGLYNGAIKNSTLSFMELTGKGEMLIENMEWYSPGPGETYNSLIYLRSDYGSTWDGTVTVRNCTAHVSPGNTYIFAHNYVNWNFGYVCHFPNLIIDNLRYEGLEENAEIRIVTEERSAKREPGMHLDTTERSPYRDVNGKESMVNTNPIAPPSFIKVINNEGGYKYRISREITFFDNTDLEGIYRD